MNKHQERFYVEHIAPALEWAIVEERERPDFILREGQQQFGLELTEVFNGPLRKKGSTLKAAEATRQEKISDCQRRHDERGGPALSVKVLGDPGDVAPDQLIEELQRYDFESMSVGEKLAIRVGEQIKVFATKALRPHWYSVDNTVGWVNPAASSILQSAIEKKGEAAWPVPQRSRFGRSSAGGREPPQGKRHANHREWDEHQHLWLPHCVLSPLSRRCPHSALGKV